MIWSEIDFHPNDRKLQVFAGLFFTATIAVAGAQFLVKERWLAGELALGLGSVVLVAGLARPGTIRWLYAGMMAASFPCGWVMSHLMLGIVYFGLFTPLSWLFRVRGRDRLHLRLDPRAATYWKVRPASPASDSYLRPF
jgi:formate-dependent nitrite reductase membrane component NrfD